LKSEVTIKQNHENIIVETCHGKSLQRKNNVTKGMDKHTGMSIHITQNTENTNDYGKDVAMQRLYLLSRLN